MNAELEALYPSVEKQLSERETKHKAHESKMEDQRLRKLDSRDRHRKGAHRQKLIPIVLK